MADDPPLQRSVPVARHRSPWKAPRPVQPIRRLAPGSLFAYVGRRANIQEHRTIATTAGGVVLRGRHAEVATHLRRAGFQGPLMIDPAVYELPADNPGDPRAHHASLLEEDQPGGYWIGLQEEQHVAAYLSPSLFVAEADMLGLRRTLEKGQAWRAAALARPHRAPAFVVLPIHRRWLTDQVEDLAAEITTAAVPVAVIPSGSYDPLGTWQAVQGLIWLLRTVPQLMLLRTDLAGIGALAHGAMTAAIGTSTAVRHFVPPGSSAGGNPQDRTPRVLVETLLTWVTGSLLAQMARDGGLLDCGCAVCHGRSLRRFGEDPALATEAQVHSILVWRTIADRVLADPAELRAATWAKHCQLAVENQRELKVRTQVALAGPSASLRAWAEHH